MDLSYDHLCFSTNGSSFHPTLLFDEYHTDYEYNQGDWPSLCSILNKEKDLHPTRGFKDTELHGKTTLVGHKFSVRY